MTRHKIISKILFFSLFLSLIGCKAPEKDYSLFEKAVAVGVNKNDKLEEASGLIASQRNPDLLWTHNDSGNPAHIFLLDKEAKTQKTFKLSKIKNRDWEDITIGAGPKENTSYLYIGDIGDNIGLYDIKYIYRLVEPAIDDDEKITEFDTLIVKLDDGSRDSETLMFDPASKNLYIVSKRESEVRLYEITHPFDGDTLVATKKISIPLTYINGGSISFDGKEVLLRNYDHIYYWKKKGDESIVELLKTPPVEIPYSREPQGESIGWALDNSGFYTLSENAKGTRAKLFYYKRK
ncbi:MAG: hypothetical protein HOP08_09150 [Cyclobacteriaceae bacterium]|nr:hypothetical protein [Cyclobacteriaceae bacterium]